MNIGGILGIGFYFCFMLLLFKHLIKAESQIKKDKQISFFKTLIDYEYGNGSKR